MAFSDLRGRCATWFGILTGPLATARALERRGANEQRDRRDQLHCRIFLLLLTSSILYDTDIASV
jgi:hypothetical protein